MSKIISAKTNSAIFLGTLLVLGTIATILPSVQAEPYYEDKYDPEYPLYQDNNYYKSKDSSSTIVKKIKCNNINSNNNGVDVSLGLPNGNDDIVEAQAEDGDQATTANDWGNGERNGYKQKDNGFKFVCVNNNDNENKIIVINETTPEPTITCEECILNNLTPDELQRLNECFAFPCQIDIGGQAIVVTSLAELCEVLQDATAAEIFEFFFSIFSDFPEQRETTANILVCLAEVFNLNTTPTL